MLLHFEGIFTRRCCFGHMLIKDAINSINTFL